MFTMYRYRHYLTHEETKPRKTSAFRREKEKSKGSVAVVSQCKLKESVKKYL